MYLLDTDILVDFLRGVKKAKEFIFAAIEREEKIFVSEISEIELLSHKRCENLIERTKVELLFKIFRKIIIDNEIGKLAGEIRRKYGLSFPDSVIAAICLLYNLTLVTRNVRDFKKVKGLKVPVPYQL